MAVSNLGGNTMKRWMAGAALAAVMTLPAAARPID